MHEHSRWWAQRARKAAGLPALADGGLKQAADATGAIGPQNAQTGFAYYIRFAAIQPRVLLEHSGSTNPN